MKKLVLILITLLVFSLVLGITAGKVGEPKDKPIKDEKNVRLIAFNTSETDKVGFVAKGCTIIHDVDELDDAVALECPSKVVKDLRYVEEDKMVTIMDLAADQQIGADRVWTSPGLMCGTSLCDGSGVTVAVLDTGVDATHPELSGSIAGGKSFVRYTSSYNDDHGHGTHVTGIITANGDNPSAKGVAPGAKVWMGKVLDGSGRGYVTDIAAAINYVVKNKKAKVISLSLGGSGTGSSYCNWDYLALTANKAVGKGVTVIAAAGNTPETIASPACGSKVIAVGAVDSNDVIASFSGTGYGAKIVAPGVSILSTLPSNQYARWSGTSMATPHVAATTAMILQAYPSASYGSITNYLYGNAKDLGAPLWDKIYGNGRVNAYCAVNAALFTGNTCVPF